MSPAEFKKKWRRYTGKESSAHQEHFNDLCRMLGQKTPVEADPSGNDFFCFQKGVVKDAELLALDEHGKPKKGFADVWRKDCFGWEYKGKHKDLVEAYNQLLRYRESLLNPPLLVVCDFDRYIVKTNFNGTVCDQHEFTNDQIDRPEVLRILRGLPAQCSIGLARYPRLVPKDADCAAQLKRRTLTNLYNERPGWLDLAHQKLDAAVAAAYGWLADLTDEQILEKLLALNLERAAEQAKSAKVKPPRKTQRSKHAEELL